MKTAIYKKGSQKGFSPIFIIIGIVVVAFGAYALLAARGPQKTQSTVTEQNQENTSLDNLLDKVVDTKYVFYYPKGYVKSESGEEDKLTYKNSNSKAVEPESIVLRIQAGSKAIQPTYNACVKIGEAFRNKGDDEIKAEVVAMDKNQGCKINSAEKVDGVNDRVVSIRKILWYKNGTDYSSYEAHAFYFENASKDEAKRLGLAIDQFDIK